jgi:hypothetical protein
VIAMTLFNKIAAGVVAFLILASFVGGCQYGKSRVHIPPVTNTVVIKPDTVVHHIYDIWPWYVQGKDTTIYRDSIIPVDTAAILKDYYALHTYNRMWQDSLLQVNLTDVITENKSIDNIFDYKLLKPFTTNITNVDNSITYNKYIYVGLDVPIKSVKNSSFEIWHAFPKGYFGLGYGPYDGFSIKGGVSIIKFKQNK